MKIPPVAVAALAGLLHRAPLAAAQECLAGSFSLEFDGECTAETVIEAYADQVYDRAGATAPSCALSAAEDLGLKLAAANLADASALCDQVYATQEKVPFTSAANRGADMHFEEMFFNGRTDWQEEVATRYETEDGTRTSVLKEDAEAVRVFFDSMAQYRRVAWPGELTNFQSSVTDSDGLPSCTTNAAMCCWPKDRQANDNNGNCATPYDLNCVDKDPADNTDLCFVDLERGNASTQFDSVDTLVYPGDNNEGEGAIHCHGLAWSNDVNDATARYKGNNIFFVAMYDHMYQRGYVKNIPGAPMCGCVEQMPTVSRSDCTQVDLTESIRIVFDAATNRFESKLTAVEVDFNACQGINNRNNDLWAYMARLWEEGEITREQFGEAGRIITDTNCEEATSFELNQKSLTPGYDHDVSTFTNVAGRDGLFLHDPYGHRAFHRALVPDTEKGHHGIIYRVCQSCIRTHKKIFYRRREPVPDGFDLMHQILHSTSQNGNNLWGVHFSLHSTYEDAVNDVDPWRCPNNSFNYGATFYGECSPDGTRVRNQRSRFHVWNEKNDVAYYTNKAEDDGLEILPTTPIKGRDRARGIALQDPTDGTIYMAGAGRDIWWWHDDFNYLSEEAYGDRTVVVHVGSISNVQPHSWSKSGIVLRSGLETNAAYYTLVLTGGNGVCFQGRLTVGAYPQHWGCVSGSGAAWLKVEKRIDTYTSFVGTQAVAGGPVSWAQVHSRVIPAIAEGASYRAGLGVSSVNYYQQEVIFSDYSSDDYYFPSAAPSVSAAPTSGSALTAAAVATQSSTCHGGAPMRALDGNPRYDWGGGSVTHTCHDAQPWWEVDLMADNNYINAVSVYNREDCCQSRMASGGTYVQVLDKDRTVVSSKLMEGTQSVYRFNFGNVVGRYVRVQKTQAGYLHIAEVEVNGWAEPGAARKLRG